MKYLVVITIGGLIGSTLALVASYFIILGALTK